MSSRHSLWSAVVYSKNIGTVCKNGPKLQKVTELSRKLQQWPNQHFLALTMMCILCETTAKPVYLSQSGRYTINAARSCFLDEEIGSLSPGKMADFVVLSVDSWDEFAAEVSASVEATYVGGLRAYARDLIEDS